MKSAYIASVIALGAWGTASSFTMRDSIPLGAAVTAAVLYFVCVMFAGFRFTSTASDPRGDGKEAVGYFVVYGMIAIVTFFPIASLFLAISGYVLHWRIVWLIASVSVIIFTPAAFLLSLACKHHVSVFPRILTPTFTICSALLFRMFYR